VAKYFKGEIIVGKDLMVVQRSEGETIMKLKLDDRFRETGLDEASIHGTGIMLVDSSFGKI
jgi:hypothetical protein